MKDLGGRALSLLLPLTIALHLWASPYTKVEESFNVQATHDILAYGILPENIDKYDHKMFPGPVPRTFVGALVLAGLSKPWLSFLSSAIDIQVLVRFTLGMYNAVALILLRESISFAFGTVAANWFVLLQASQFHVMYYASRTLPNMFALGLCTTALGSIITIQPRRLAPLTAIKHARVAIYLLAVSAVVFRAELVLLAAAEAGYLLLRERVPLKDVIFAGLAGTIVGLCVTVPIDSYLWGYYPLWPELSGFYYNTVQGRASAWGVSPWHYYFTAALPRLLLNPISWIVCIPVAIGQRSTASSAANILLPLLVFISLYSFLPHKEWRFIVYTVPAFSAVAAVGASWIWNRRRKTALYTLLNVILVGSVLLTFLASCVMLGISTTNYPGARALARLHSIDNSTASVRRLYLDNLSCQTGVTHFVERSSPVFGDHTVKNTTWLYDKAGDDSNLHSPAFWQKYDYILTESLETTIGKWQPVEVIRGYSGFEFVDESVHPTTQLDPVYIKFQVPSYWRIYSALSNVERGLRFHVTGGRWPNVRLEPKIWILKHQNPEAQRIHP